MWPKFKETIPYFVLDKEILIGEEEGVAGFVDDPDGSIALLVETMDGNHSIQEIIAIVQNKYPHISPEDIESAILTFNSEGYIEDASKQPPKLTNYELERYKANINYFSLFTDIEGNKYEIQENINDLKISLLGIGGLGSQLLYHLAALGFHNIKALDFDTLDLSNFNRQLLYSESDIGELKTSLAKKRIAQFNPNVNLQITNKKIESPEDVYHHINGTELVICVADRPTLDLLNWVNKAVIKAGIPMISGGVLNTRGRFFSIIPGETGCVQCHIDSNKMRSEKQDIQFDYMRKTDFQRKNAAISPNVAMLAGILLSETLKLIIGNDKPISLGKIMEYNFLNFTVSEISSWNKNDHCSVCSQRIQEDHNAHTKCI